MTPRSAAALRPSLALPSVLAALALVGLLAPPPAAAAPTELFFTEYIEGSSNNKALEIYNGTGAAINLSTGAYSVQMCFNGALTCSLTINLTGTVAAGDVYVVAHASADGAILAVADQTNGSGWFNGNDAVLLRKAGIVIDSIGQRGFDPGSQWGSGLVSTADNTLRRKNGIEAGDAVDNDVFDPAVQWDGFANNTFGGLGCHPASVCNAPPPEEAEIYEIQGNGLASPLVGVTVTTSGNVVTAVTPIGFFMQTPDDRADLDPETSNGIFVFTAGPPAVNVGDDVDVTGMVAEFFNFTEIDGPEIEINAFGSTLPAVQMLGPTVPSPNRPQPATEMERFEGMLVRVENAIASGPTDQFGDTPVVATGARAFREPGILFPGLAGLPVWDGNPELFEINHDQAGLPPMSVPAGAAIEFAEGPLGFDFGDYQIWPTTISIPDASIDVRPVRAREPLELTIGSQNMLRLMDTVNDPDCSDDVPTPAELAHRLDKLSRQVREALGAPDVLAVEEVENELVLQALAAQIAADDPSVVYTAYLMEGNDIGCIDVGFLVRDTVTVDSVEQLGADTVFPLDGSLLNDRPPLLLRGAYTGNGGAFPLAVIAVHQRSLSGIEGESANANRVRQKRHAQAVQLAEHVQDLQESEPGVHLAVLGDFNAFEFTDGYVDVMGQVTGTPDPAGALIPVEDVVDPPLANRVLDEPAEERYSFVFDGSAQALDHAITSEGLDAHVRGFAHSRGNADAPAAYDEVAGTALRSADHDGMALFLMPDSDEDGVLDDADLCAGTVIPEGVSDGDLKPWHWALVDGDGTFDTRAAGKGPGVSFTVEDTAGCSCTQILAAMGFGAGQEKHGCSTGTMQDWVALIGE
jgi:predicted extracellular nuclease